MTTQYNRIFVVDNDEMMIEYLIEALSLKGYTVEGADSAEKTIEKIKDWPVDLFLIDILMPGMGGIELLKKLDIKNNMYEAIIITGHADLGSAKEAVQYGAFSYISKPINDKDLVIQIEKALEMVALRQEKNEYLKTLKYQAEKTGNDLKELTGIIYFIEEVANKIHGLLDTDKIYSVVTEEFRKKEAYDCTIVLLDDKGKLIIEKASNVPVKAQKIVEKLTGFKMKSFDLLKSKSFREVVERGKTISVDSRTILKELLPGSVGKVIEKIVNYENKESIIVPLRKNQEIIGAFVINNPKLAGFFVPSVENLCRHISTALELADEYAERKKAEEALQKSEETLRSILDSSPDAITVTDLTGKITDCNPATLKMHGFTKKKELIGRNAFDLIASESHKKAEKNLKKTMEKGFVKNIEYTLIKKDGQEFPGELSASVIKDPDGNPVSFVAITKDITERKHVEEERERARAFMQTVIDGFPEALMVINRDYTIALANNKVRAVTGGKDPVAACLKCHQVSHGRETPCDCDKHTCPIKEVIETKAHVVLEHIHHDAQGREINFELSAAPIFDDKGEVVQIIESSRDITERKKTEEEILSLSKFPSENPNPVLRIDKKGNILYKNEVVKYILKEAGLQEKDIYKILPGNLKKVIAQSLKTGKPLYGLEVIIGDKVYSYTMAPVVENRYVNLYARDITEREKAEEALRENEKKLSEQNIMLQEKNIALREVMVQLEAEKDRLGKLINLNVDRLLLPLVAKLRNKGSNLEKTYINLLEENLKDLISQFGSKISEIMLKLTQKEIEMCNMIRQGLTSKEIAKLLDISYRTVETHRNNIRKKLGIMKQEVNLVTYLKNMA